ATLQIFFPDHGSVESTTEPILLQQEQLQQKLPLGEELKETNKTTESQQLTPEEIIKVKNLLEIQLQQEKINSLTLETQKVNLEHYLIQKQEELENNQKLSEQEKQEPQNEINQLTTNFQQKEKEYQATIYQKEQETTHLNQTINEQAKEINRLSEKLEKQIYK
ncbi:hypothetical protein M8044_000527, partial [Columbia Basin potato purple top phytoplasma]|nr:hypothetical protein [Columbia Basin potato purple top phytoplasma]